MNPPSPSETEPSLSSQTHTVQAPPARGAEHFGSQAWDKLLAFAQLLENEGEKRGLVGPRELSKLWDRHILNSTVLISYLPENAELVDIGSGAGFPGIVMASVRPDLRVSLVETMERRTVWLNYVVHELGLLNVRVLHSRAEELPHSRFRYATARAVAPLKKLVPWTLPLLKDGGELLALKGARAEQEIDEAAQQLRKYRAAWVNVDDCEVWGASEGTRLVVVKKL